MTDADVAELTMVRTGSALPQQRTLPSEMRAQVCVFPPSTAFTPVRSRPEAVLTFRGIEWGSGSAEPMRSSPFWF